MCSGAFIVELEQRTDEIPPPARAATFGLYDASQAIAILNFDNEETIVGRIQNEHARMKQRVG
jgi:hypothetical protein